MGREAGRIASAFLIYLLLQWFWTWSGLGEWYNSLVMGLAAAIFIPTQHFPVVPTLKNISLRNLDFAVVFTLSLFLVSTRVPWLTRLKRFALLLLVIYGLHVLTVILEVKVISALDLNRKFDLLILLPWEFKILERCKYLLYDFGLQAGPFVLALLTVAWNLGLSLPGRARQRGRVWRRLVLSSVSLGVVLGAVMFWSWWRESQPLHVAAHVTQGRLYQKSGSLSAAEEQYLIAMENGTDNPQVFYSLAEITSQAGRTREALDFLRQGQQLTADSEWSARFEDAIANLASQRNLAPLP